MFDVSQLTDYSKKATQLLTEALVYPTSYADFDSQQGVNYKSRMNFLDATPVIQEYSCSMATSGGTAFSEKDITVGNFGTKSSYCLDDLKKKDPLFSEGNTKSTMNRTLAQSLVEDNLRKLEIKMAKTFYYGEIANGDLINGLIPQVKADSDVVSVTASAITLSNIDDIVEDMILAIPEEVSAERTDLVIRMSQKHYNEYRANRIASNMYHDNPANLGKTEMDVFGYPEIKIKAEPGFTGKDEMILTWNKNIVRAVDQVASQAKAKFAYVEVEEDKNDTVYFIGNWKTGVGYKFGSEIVLFEIA